MCGIVGVWSRTGPLAPGDREGAEAMLEAVASRGPDGRRILHAPDLALGHARLALHDPSPAGAMPFGRPGEEPLLAANATIHNAPELRALLRARGAQFRSASDCEVLAPLYEAMGPPGLARLRGPFAFALHRPQARELVLARDRFGEKPLFYVLTGDRCIFASTLQALRRALPRLSPDPESRRTFLRCGYVPGPATPYREVRAVPPGCAVLVSGDQVRVLPFASPLEAVRFEHAAEAERALDAALVDAVQARLAVERPLGVLLSGGVDSTLLLATIAAQGRQLPPCFTLGFPGLGFDERPAAALAALRLGAPHEALVYDGDPFEDLSALVRATGELLADSSWIAFAAVARAARTRVRVLLSGDGADELFLGYRRHRALALSRHVPTPLARCIAPIAPPSAARALQAFSASRPPAIYAELVGLVPWRVLAPELVPEARAAGDPLAQLLDALGTRPTAASASHADLQTYLPGDLCPKSDRGALVHGVEVLAPYLDPNLARIALGLPENRRRRGPLGKLPLRRRLARHLPSHARDSRKRGFAVPLAHWLRHHAFGSRAETLAGDLDPVFEGLLPRGAARAILIRARGGEDPLLPLAYACTVLALHASS
jgi:asparagine synthase (glutamine-hydrolysing)